METNEMPLIDADEKKGLVAFSKGLQRWINADKDGQPIYAEMAARIAAQAARLETRIAPTAGDGGTEHTLSSN